MTTESAERKASDISIETLSREQFTLLLDSLPPEQLAILHEKLLDSYDRYDTIRQQTVLNLEQLEAFPKALQKWIQTLADSRDLQAHASDIILTTKDLMYRNIFRFQIVPTFVDAFTCYRMIIYLSRRFLPIKTFQKHQGRITHYKQFYRVLCDDFGILPHSRALDDTLDADFYEIFDYLMNTRILTAAEASQAYESFSQERAKAFQEAGYEP